MILVPLACLALGAAVALAAGSATLSVSPNTAGKGSTTTIVGTPPDPNRNPDSLALRVVKGVKVDPRAVAAKCSKQQADSNNCPAKSRIGGGTANVTAKVGAFTTHVTVNLDLYLAPPQKSGDIAGVVMHAKEPQSGDEGHVTGRIHKIAIGRLGIETRFDNLDKAIKPPSGVKAHVDKVKLTFGKHRRIKRHGKRVKVFLIRNPKTCDKSWPYQILIGYPGSGDVSYSKSVTCKSG